ncbi:unnamed protein product [Boreogadus saida]
MLAGANIDLLTPFIEPEELQEMIPGESQPTQIFQQIWTREKGRFCGPKSGHISNILGRSPEPGPPGRNWRESSI